MKELSVTNGDVEATYDLFMLPSMRTNKGLLAFEDYLDNHPVYRLI